MSYQPEYFREKGFSKETADKLRSFISKRLDLQEKDIKTMVEYLSRRKTEVERKKRFGVVFDITHYCNLVCEHCAVNAIFTEKSSESQFEISTEDACIIIDKVSEYAHLRNYPAFFMFGGGEPTLRTDFKEVVRYAHKKFGMDGVGFNTNGTTFSISDLLEIEKYVSVIEISLDGFEKYHNSWRNPKELSTVKNPYEKAVNLVLAAIQHQQLQEKIEVTSIATKDNISQIPKFIRHLSTLGVKNYSVHRAMPVGRMAHHLDKIPDMRDYAKLFIEIAKMKEDVPMKDIHIHHSLESIYSALLLGEDLHLTFLPGASGRHSIGIDPYGNVYFDPWCMVKPYNILVAGNLLSSPEIKLIDIIENEGSIIKVIDELSKKRLRCKQCHMNCGGGMRFNAMAHYIAKRPNDVHESHLIAGLSQIDPACPLSEYA